MGLKMGKSTGLDEIAVRFLRDGALLLAGPLCHVINLLVERQIGHFSNYCYRGDRALKIAMGGYFELNFSFLRVRE